MPLCKLTGIILRYADYREVDRILTLFSREKGKIAISARGCRRQNNPISGSCQLFAYSEIVAFENRGRYTINTADLCEAFYPIREDIDRFTCASFVTTLCDFLIGDDEQSEEMFTLLYHTLSFLSYTDIDPLDMAICFAVRALRISGYMPVLSYCVKCRTRVTAQKTVRFAPDLGGSVCDSCSSESITVSALALEAMRRMSQLADKDIRKVKLPETVRKELLTLLRAYSMCTFDNISRVFDIIQHEK